MRFMFSACAAIAAGLSLSPCVAGQTSLADQTSAPRACLEIVRTLALEDAARRTHALNLLGSATQLLSPLGMSVLDTNLATTVAINNEATPALRARALIDALITNENANTLADGLGDTMASIYRAKAKFWSDDDGAHPHCGDIGPSVTALIGAVNATSADDSRAGKNGFADAKTRSFPLPSGGVYDVLGKAYRREAGSLGAGSLGNSRPFQIAPIWASPGPRTRTYDGTDFFNRATNSRLLLMGPTAADTAEGRTGSDLTNSPSFPSGHTTFGYSEALILAMMVPERYRALAYRGSEYGNSRIVLGAHYAVDVIAGRTLATYDLAQDLAGRPGYAQVPGLSFRAALAAGAGELRTYLQKNGCPSIATCATRDPIARAADATILTNGNLTPSTTGQAYAFRLHYGLATMGDDNQPAEPVPAEAAILLETRFPYLTDAQRREVLRTSEGPAGHFLDVSPLNGRPLAAATGAEAEVGAYSRLDLYRAAGGYSSFADQVTVDQDPSDIVDPDLAPFLDLARRDIWANNIGGPGGLTKLGSGTLSLSGANTYAGPTIVRGGTLEITGSIASAAKIESNGTLAGTGTVGDVVVASGGTVAPGAANDSRTLRIGGALKLEPGAHLVAKAGTAPRPGELITILTARGGISGTFADVGADMPSLVAKLTYAKDAIYLTFEQKGAAPAN